MGLLPDIEGGEIKEEKVSKPYTPPVKKYSPGWPENDSEWNNDGHKKVAKDFSDSPHLNI